MPLPGLRFRPTATRETPTEIPKTPRSPPGVYSGVPVPPLSRSRRRRKHWRKSFGLLVCILICTYLLICWWSTDALLQSRKWPLPQIPWQSPIRVSIRFGKTETKTKSFAPHFHTHEHRFRDDAAFQDSTSRGDNAWLSMFPSGDGSIAVKNPRQYGLPPSSVAVDGQGNKVVDTEIYDVSVVRQLGCLALLRDFIIDHDATISRGSYIHRHALHCLDHVRQALLCAADTTLEPTGDDTVTLDTEPDLALHQTHMDMGFASARHTCRNYTEIQEWMEANKIKV